MMALIAAVLQQGADLLGEERERFQLLRAEPAAAFIGARGHDPADRQGEGGLVRADTGTRDELRKPQVAHKLELTGIPEPGLGAAEAF